MRIIFKIARAELRTLFYSPIAWLVVLIFYITMAAIFSIGLEKATVAQEVMQELQSNWVGFAGIGRDLTFSILTKITGYIYLFMPLLTMGVINREISNGTIKLLYSSPVTTTEIVLGKFLGLVFFNFILLFIYTFILFSVYLTVENAEYLWYFSILLGSFLLINTYAAIGLFISCLTGYQIVAAVITFTVFFLLSAVSGLWQQYDLIRDITYALSIAGKSERMMGGLITSRDVIYFLLIISLFIGFSMIKLKSTQESKRWTVVASKYTILSLIVIMLGYFSSRPGHILYFDLTKNKINTIHPAFQEEIKKLDGSPLTITLYTNLLDRNAPFGLPQYRNTYLWNIWEPFIRFYPNIELRYEYYYDILDGDSSLYYKYPGKSIDEIMALQADIVGIRTSLFKKPQEMRKQLDLASESFKLVMQLEYKGKKSFLRTYEDATVWPSREHIAGSIKRLTRESPVNIAVLSGHYDRDPFDFAPRNFAAHLTAKISRGAMVNYGVDTDTLLLSKNNIPQDLNLLVIADPRSALDESEQQKISNWMNKGGNMLIYAEPGKQSILDAIVQATGVQLEAGIIVNPNKDEMPHIFKTNMTKAGNFMAKEPDLENYQLYGEGGGIVEHEGALNLVYTEINGFKIEPVFSLRGNDKTWIEHGKLVVDSAAPEFKPAEGDVQKSEYITAVKLSRNINGKEQRIVITGDADFMTGRRVSANTVHNALYSWLLYNQYPVYGNYPMSPDRFLKVNNRQAKMIVTIYLYIISAAILTGAIVLLVRRKRK